MYGRTEVDWGMEDFKAYNMYMQGFHPFKTMHILKLFACCQGNLRQLQRKGILGVA